MKRHTLNSLLWCEPLAPTESVFDVRMLHTHAAMAATVALMVIKLEGTTFV